MLLNKIILRYLLSALIFLGLLFPSIRDCPENFVTNPDYPYTDGPECFPEDFVYVQSTLQAFYYFNDVTIRGLPLDNDDWVAAFNGETCIGSRLWDISQCNSNVCDVPIMGNDGESYSFRMPINASPEFDSLFAEVEIEKIQEVIFLDHKVNVVKVFG